MRIAVYGRLVSDEDSPHIQAFFDTLSKRKIEFVIYESLYASLADRLKFKKDVQTFNSHKDLSSGIDYLFSLGGDGTLLDTLTLVRDSGIPIMGINIGRLGFLASIGKMETEAAITALEKGTYVLDERTLLHLDSNKSLFGDTNYCLNDFTIHKKDTSSMMTIHTYLNGEYLNSYWADGLIVSTPTGSTGYSLSCGGPVIFPKSENFIITPVAPHNLNVRPIIVPDDNVISFEIEDRNKNFLCSMDSRFETIDSSFELAVRKANFTINLVRLNDNNFLSTLRNKLLWGIDQRN